jgi:transcriptional regulator with XRE-family HTH domain
MTSTQDRPDAALRLTQDLPTDGMEIFGDVLRAHREQQGLTQEAAAALVGVSRATFTQWETHKHLPSAARTDALDRALRAGGALAAALQATRGPRGRTAGQRGARPAGPTLLQVTKQARRVLREQMCFDPDGRAAGWRHNLVPSNEPPSTLSTIYGIGALGRLGGPDEHTPAVVDRIVRTGVEEDGTIGGWHASVQLAPRIEATADAIESLLRAGVPLGADQVLRVLGEQLEDATARERPFILTLALAPLLRIAPDSDLTRRVLRLLLELRQEFDGVLLWTEKTLERDQPMVEPSVAHTARAVSVLRDAGDELVGDAVTSAEEWLATRTNLDGVTEIVRRTLPGGHREELAFHHFTAALVARALAGAERPDRVAIERALDVVWERYDHSLHLWTWSNGDTPVWLLKESLEAVQDAALALTTASTIVPG